MPDAPSPPGTASPAAPPRRRASVLIRAPPPPVTAGLIAVVSLAIAAALWPPPHGPWLTGWLASLLLPALVAALTTTPLARARAPA